MQRFSISSGDHFFTIFKFNYVSCFRTSTNSISRILKRFFESPLHLASQFNYLTKAGDLTDQVEKNLKKQLG